MENTERYLLSASEIANLIFQGITQAELRAKTGWNGWTVSKRALSMEKKKLITRTEALLKGRYTFLLQPSPGISIDALTSYFVSLGRRPGPNLDFVAPSLTPSIQRAVSLRLEGHTIREIAKIMNRSTNTIGIDLRYARRPELFYRDKMLQKERQVLPDGRVLNAIKNTLRIRGFMFTDEGLDGVSKTAFGIGFHYLLEKDVVKDVTFVGGSTKYRIWELYGSLAKRRVIYLDSEKLTSYITRTLHLSPRLPLGLKQALTRGFANIFFKDPQTLSLLRAAMRSN